MFRLGVVLRVRLIECMNTGKDSLFREIVTIESDVHVHIKDTRFRCNGNYLPVRGRGSGDSGQVVQQHDRRRYSAKLKSFPTANLEYMPDRVDPDPQINVRAVELSCARRNGEFSHNRLLLTRMALNMDVSGLNSQNFPVKAFVGAAVVGVLLYGIYVVSTRSARSNSAFKLISSSF